MRHCIVNLGCKVNRVEADGFERQLRAAGSAPAELSQADLVVVNTCTVTGEADKKARKAVRQALRANPSARVLVTGCAAALRPGGFEALGERVSAVGKEGMGAAIAGAVEALRGGEGAMGAAMGGGSGAGGGAWTVGGMAGGVAGPAGPGPSLVAAAPPAGGAVEPACAAPLEGPSALPPGGRARVGVKVQDGCDNACTYCIVHVARGPARSVPAAAIAAEVEALARAGVREVVLTGINLGSYRDGATDLPALLGLLLARTAGLHGPDEPPCRFRLSSIEPADVSPGLVEALAAAEGRLCRHLHLPLQSGSSRVLAEMARPYDAEAYVALVEGLRASLPRLALATDVIVGFPGEAEGDFERTCAVARACGFMNMHVFPYSRREGTPAAERADQVAAPVRADRAARLRALAARLRDADRAARAGSVELALVEAPGRAMTESYYEVTPPDPAPLGRLVRLTLD